MACAVDVEPSRQLIFCLADAALYAGDYPRALSEFRKIADGNDIFATETRLKILLAEWADREGIDAIGDRGRMYDLRLLHLSSDAPQKGFRPHLALSFRMEDDVPCWADAIFLAVLSGDPQTIEDVLVVAQERCGLEAYAAFREERSRELWKIADGLDELDRLAAELNEA